MARKNITAEAIPYPKRREVYKPYPSTQPVTKETGTEKETASNNAKSKLKVAGLGTGMFLLALLTVAQFAFVTHYNYEVNQLEQKKEKLQDEKQRLEMKAVELKSHERIEHIAREELNMKRPTDILEVRQ